jgi:hypothetical protein
MQPSVSSALRVSRPPRHPAQRLNPPPMVAHLEKTNDVLNEIRAYESEDVMGVSRCTRIVNNAEEILEAMVSDMEMLSLAAQVVRWKLENPTGTIEEGITALFPTLRESIGIEKVHVKKALAVLSHLYDGGNGKNAYFQWKTICGGPRKNTSLSLLPTFTRHLEYINKFVASGHPIKNTTSIMAAFVHKNQEIRPRSRLNAVKLVLGAWVVALMRQNPTLSIEDGITTVQNKIKKDEDKSDPTTVQAVSALKNIDVLMARGILDRLANAERKRQRSNAKRKRQR